jgi:hypothetical protein
MLMPSAMAVPALSRTAAALARIVAKLRIAVPLVVWHARADLGLGPPDVTKNI